MPTPSYKPELVINYSPALDLRITFVYAQGYEEVSLPEYRFAVDCLLRHASGCFTYSVSDLCFDIKSFASFSTELQGLQQGLSQQASLKNVGEMMVLRLEGNSRGLRATLNIREYLAPQMATLNAILDVDYDLFVNKLRVEVDRFVEELRQMQPSPPEQTK
jgi:choline kinase